MPIKSEKQRRAMQAAAKGKSTLGISKKVAKKYLSHGKKRKKKSTQKRKKKSR